MLRHLYKRHFQGPGGINILASIAFPVIVSEASDTAMMFVDRLFLSQLTSSHMAAAMSGGLTCFMFMTFFFGLLGYANAMVAQYYGAGQPRKCPVVIAQALLLLVVFYPLLLACKPLGLKLFQLFGHDPVQLRLESEYFSILLFGGIFSLIRVVLASFFAGIGRTRVIMGANLAAMGVNIVANYVLIFGKWGFPAMGIAGAALGTIAGSAVCALILGVAYSSRRNREEFGIGRGVRFAPAVLRRFLHFGFPSGIEFLLNMAAFNLIVQIFHSYGRDVAAAVTIAFNWDMVSFVPMIGLNVGVTSLVGRYMGSRNPDMAARTAHSGMAFVALYGGILTLLFVFVPGPLVRLFTTGEGDYQQVVELAVPMLRLAALYVLSDGTYLVFSGAIRGAGDTRWSMAASVVVHWLLAATALVMIGWLRLSPLLTWTVFVCEVWLLGGIFYWRFRQGRWRTIQVVESAPTATPPLDPGLV